MSGRAAQIQVLLEGVPLPATKTALLLYARREGSDPAALALLEALPDREYGSLDEVGELIYPVQPVRAAEPQRPHAESGLPPGGSAYTDPSAEPGAVRERGPEG